jgi:hypothetical protein
MLLVLVTAVHQRDVVGAVEAADVADDLRYGPAELVTDGDGPGPAELAGLDGSKKALVRRGATLRPSIQHPRASDVG